MADTADSISIKSADRPTHCLMRCQPKKLHAVRSLLGVMVKPLARSLALAQVEEEDLTPDTAATLERARASLARGEGIPHDEICANSA
jgi:hypothetical protein